MIVNTLSLESLSALLGDQSGHNRRRSGSVKCVDRDTRRLLITHSLEVLHQSWHDIWLFL